MRYMLEFPRGIPHFRAGYPRVTHPSATQPRSCPLGLVRLACVKHAASVHSEPGSNSPLKVFSRHGPRRNSHRQIRVKSCFSIQETLLFLKKQEKDVWHALLSFQGTESPGSPRRTTPCFRRSEWKRPSEDGNFSFFDFRRSVNCFPRSRPSGERRLAQRRDPLKIWEPLRGCAI